MRFTLLDKKNKLVFSIPTRFTTNSIKKFIIYISFSINNYKIKSLPVKISRILTHCLSFIVNKLSMIYLKFFASVDQ